MFLCATLSDIEIIFTWFNKNNSFIIAIKPNRDTSMVDYANNEGF